MPHDNVPRAPEPSGGPTSPTPSHKVAAMTTAALLALWLAGTVLARPITPWLAEAAVQVERILGLDASQGAPDS